MGFGSEYGNGGPGILPGHFIVCSSLLVDALGSASEAWLPFLRRWFPPLTGVFLSFASPKESKQRKGDPGSVPAAPVPCASRRWRGLRNSGLRPQTVLALCPPAPALLGTSQGARKASRRERSAFGWPVAVDGEKRAKIKIWLLNFFFPLFRFQGEGKCGWLRVVMPVER
jgi:hypothetical protein